MHNDQAHIVVDFQHVKPGKGQAFVRTNLKNVKDGKVIEKTFKTGDSFDTADVSYLRLQFLYNDGDDYYFMDENYEQTGVREEVIGSAKDYLVEEAEVDGMYIDGELTGINLKPKMEFKVIQAPPGAKGDTATGGKKAVKIETGAMIKTPLFINEGDVIIVNTETGDYVSRA